MFYSFHEEERLGAPPWSCACLRGRGPLTSCAPMAASIHHVSVLPPSRIPNQPLQGPDREDSREHQAAGGTGQAVIRTRGPHGDPGHPEAHAGPCRFRVASEQPPNCPALKGRLRGLNEGRLVTGVIRSKQDPTHTPQPGRLAGSPQLLRSPSSLPAPSPSFLVPPAGARKAHSQAAVSECDFVSFTSWCHDRAATGWPAVWTDRRCGVQRWEGTVSRAATETAPWRGRSGQGPGRMGETQNWGPGSFSAENNTGGVRQPRCRAGTAGGQQGRRAQGSSPTVQRECPRAEEGAADGPKRGGGVIQTTTPNESIAPRALQIVSPGQCYYPISQIKNLRHREPEAPSRQEDGPRSHSYQKASKTGPRLELAIIAV